MSLFNRLRKIAETHDRLRRQAGLWAARFCPGPQERVASIVVCMLAGQWGGGFERMTPTTRFIEDLGMEDMGPVELVMELEEKFGIQIPGEDAGRMATLGVLISYLQERVQMPVT